jgi:accessory colonization factor AcfC
MLYSGTDPESYITEYTSVYEEKPSEKLTLGQGRTQAWTNGATQPQNRAWQ